jgi:mannose-6-phosphate isomerase-like protein (cupin superfamily)
MKSTYYLDLQTGEVISAKQRPALEKGKENAIRKAADEMYSLLVSMAEDRERELQRLQAEVSSIRDYLKKYDDATEMLDGREREPLAPKKQRVANVAYVPPDEAKSFWLAGELYTAKAVGEHTKGAFTLIEALTPPGSGWLPHIHYREDKTFYVLEGELEFMVEGDLLEVGAGAFLHVGRGTLHTYKNSGTRPARYMGLLAPAGIEKFFEEVSVPATDRSSPPPFEQEDLEGLLAEAPKFGLEIRLPSET